MALSEWDHLMWICDWYVVHSHDYKSLLKCHKDIDQWIVNIDLDFFFTGEDGECSQFITRKYIKNICKEIKNSLPQIDVVTIAISPEFCNGWGNAFNILRVITTELDIYMPYKYKRYKKHSFLF